MKETKVIEIKPYTLQELANLYGVSKPTFRKWIKPFEKEIGKRNGHYYTIAQVRIIFDKLSLPSTVRMNEEFER